MTPISLTCERRRHAAACLGTVLLALGLAGCAAPPAASSKTELPFEQAVANATDGLVAQTQKLPGFLAQVGGRRSVVIDPMIDAGSAQQTAATQALQSRVIARMTTKFESVEILPFERANLAKARYLLTGTMTRLSPGQPQSPLQIDLALTELGSGTVAAHASAVARDEGLNHTPLPYYQDIPVPTRDLVIESYVRTTATPQGQRADPYYLERIAVAPVIQQATSLYNAERYQDALAQYNAAGGSADGEQLRVLNGIYLSSAKLGRTAEAEQAFGKIVSYGIANRQLGVKFLFNPGGTVFWSEPRISGPYAMWLREIAKASADARVCMEIVGHTSHTGSVAYNDGLSLQRARYVRQRLIGESTALRDRTTFSGRGFRENIIGSGTDDAADALDRRVEFKIVGCDAAAA
ncbi:OmpA family protein [Variovorax sp. J22G21]|uniref:OmpA family protein n=1 Tax=Variovorax fucosicus TaxID=3053517 RepID=UPI0025767C35|nr:MULTISPECIES: OmpA family protein [unclassified Variovorax]MDM0040125.1 OmpA family protein [Variovorax sp. J22R193]MDM0061498.1 OmpA family protein [Variovorax sp. J22G21]